MQNGHTKTASKEKEKKKRKKPTSGNKDEANQENGKKKKRLNRSPISYIWHWMTNDPMKNHFNLTVFEKFFFKKDLHKNRIYIQKYLEEDT